MAGPNFWEQDELVGPARGPQPVLTLPDARGQAQDSRADAGLENDQTRTGIALRGEVRDVDRQSWGQVKDLRDEFGKRPATEVYQTIMRQYGQALRAEDNPAGDQARINAYAQMLMPTSTVMPAEYEATREALNTNIQNITIKLKREFGWDGTGSLSPQGRKWLSDAMHGMTVNANSAYNQDRQFYSQLAERRGYDPYEVVGDHAGRPYYDLVERARGGDQQQPAEQPVAVTQTGQQGPSAPTSTTPPPAKFQGPDGTWYQHEGAAPRDPGADPNGVDLPTARQAKASWGKLSADYVIPTGSTLAQIQQLAYDAMRKKYPKVPMTRAQFIVEPTYDVNRERSPGMDTATNLLRGAFAAPDLLVQANNALTEGAGDVVSWAATGGGASKPNAVSEWADSWGDSPQRTASEMLEQVNPGAGEQAGALAAQLVGGFALPLPGAGAIKPPAAGYNALSRAASLGDDATRVAQGFNDDAARVVADDAADSSPDAIATIARQATGSGAKAQTARQTLAQMARANPEAAAAAERLGIDLPLDILSDSAQFQSLNGLIRSQAGSTAESGWIDLTKQVSAQADDAMARLGAETDLAQVSDDIFRRMNSSTTALETRASALRDEVTAAIPNGARIDASNLEQALARTIDDYGGLAEAKAAMTPQERSMLAMLGEGESALRPTYARLNRLRDDIGEALNKNKGPWVDVNRRQLSEYYRALADDQMAAVETIGGAAVADKQRAANTLFSQMYRQRSEMVDVFGKQLEQTALAPMLRSAITSGAKGDGKKLAMLLDRIPEQSRAGAILSAIESAAQTKGRGGFSFANYSNIYRGLRESGPVYGKISKVIGKDASRVLDDLYQISSRMVAGEAKVLKTGKANQVLQSALEADGVMRGILDAATGRAGTAIGTAIGGSIGGLPGAGAGAGAVAGLKHAMTNMGSTRLERVHTLFSSPQFRSLIDKYSVGETPDINMLWGAPSFHKLAKSLGIINPEQRRAWLNSLATRGGISASAQPRMIEQFETGPQRLAAQPSAESSTTTEAQR